MHPHATCFIFQLRPSWRPSWKPSWWPYKGHLISKGLFGFFNSSKNEQKHNSNMIKVNICQKLSFLPQIIHNMTTIIHWITSSVHKNSKLRTWEFQAQNMSRTCCVHKLFLFLFWHSEQFHVHNMFWAWNFHEQSFVIFWVSWCKNKCFWKRFTCTSNCFRSFFGRIEDTKKYF